MKRPESLREYRWLVAPEVPSDSSLHTIDDAVRPVLRQILYNRGLTQPGQIQSFLENHYLQSRDPFGLADMEPAAERIIRALRDGWNHDSDGYNVSVHEWAHVLDLEDGFADGIPGLAPGSLAEEQQMLNHELVRVRGGRSGAVSYTHLTLPTNREV